MKRLLFLPLLLVGLMSPGAFGQTCPTIQIVGQAGVNSLPPNDINGVVGNGNHTFTVYYIQSGVQMQSTLRMEANPGSGLISVTGSWGGPGNLNRVTSVSASGNSIRFNGATALTFNGISSITGSLGFWPSPGGLVFLRGDGATGIEFRGFNASTGSITGTTFQFYKCQLRNVAVLRQSGLIQFKGVDEDATLIEFLVDGGVVGSMPGNGSSLGFTYDYDSTNLQNGLHQLRVRTTYPGGLVKTTPSPLRFVVNNSILSMGGSTSCGIDGGQAFCWGSNSSGQLGNGNNVNSSSPVSVVGLTSNVEQISSGGSSTCAIRQGIVWCWGANSYGQLGNGTTTASNVPVQITSLGVDNQFVTVGLHHACALKTNGRLFCWGRNQHGQLGLGNTTNSSVPVQYAGPFLQMVSAGASHTCGLNHTRLVICWGLNASGQLGNGTNTSASLPVTVTPALPEGEYISAGYNHTCAVNNGAAFCWGSNSSGVLGNGNTTSSNVAVSVFGLADPGAGVKHIQASLVHSCAATAFSLKCWGNNANYQLGNGSTTSSLTPVNVTTLGSMEVDSHFTGYNGSCAVRAGGFYCWGRNSSGEVGKGNTNIQSTPFLLAL